ncbi:MAG: rod shape-determining protein MreC [Candidatus Eisenbacteria bacterium]
MLAQLSRVLRGNRELSTFLFCAVLSFVFLALPPGAKGFISTVLSGAVLGPVERISSAVVQRGRVSEENAALRRIAIDLMTERSALVDYRLENERLRELVGFLVAFPEEELAEMIPARVIGMPGGRVVESMKIDKGLRDSLEVDMPIVVPGGLAGKISSVSHNHSMVEPLTSASSGVSVMTERGRVRGVVKPRFGGASRRVSWEIDYVQARSDVREGDLVVTSGLGGIYPAGITVGRVLQAVEGPLTMSIEVELAIDFSTVEQVFVLTGKTGVPTELDELRERLMMELESERAALEGRP